MLRQMTERNRDGSHATQANRARMLSLMADQLDAAGFKTNEMTPQDLKGRHVNRLLSQWQQEGISTGTIKNRMAVLRWWAEKIGNSGAMKADNADYGIENRKYVTNEDKAVKLADLNLSKASDHVRASLQLQSAFGLRREEAMKFQPSYALDGKNIDSAEKIRLKGSWTKGGREREIPITNEQQRELLRQAARLAGSGSLIPPEKTYKQHLNTFETESRNAGNGNTHGLRHDYAQRRYVELCGFQPPAVSGIRCRDMSPEQRAADGEARRVITAELGHGRTAITAVYLGS